MSTSPIQSRVLNDLGAQLTSTHTSIGALVTGPQDALSDIRQAAQHASFSGGFRGYVDLDVSGGTEDLSGKLAYLTINPKDLLSALNYIAPSPLASSTPAVFTSSAELATQRRGRELADRLLSLGTAQAAVIAVDLNETVSPSLMNLTLSLMEERRVGKDFKLPKKLSCFFVAGQNEAVLSVALRNRTDRLAFDQQGDLIAKTRIAPEQVTSDTSEPSKTPRPASP